MSFTFLGDPLMFDPLEVSLLKSVYKDKIDANKKSLDELRTSPSSLEKFVRETYLMKKDDEDLFVIVPDTVK